MRTRKGTAKLTGNVREVKPPPPNRVLERNGPPVKVITYRDYRRMIETGWSPWQ